MKYLNNREEFLKYKINEAFNAANSSGPGANDVNWGDSLVGRLINSFRRKVGIGVNMVRINQCTKQLKRQFDDIIYYAEVQGLTEEESKIIGEVILNEVVNTIYIAIKDKKNIGFSSDDESDAGEQKETIIKDDVYLKEVGDIIMSGISSLKEYKRTMDIENIDTVINSLKELSDEVKDMKSKLKTTTTQDDKKFEKDKYYLYKNEQNKVSLFYITNIGDNNKGFQWNSSTMKWGNIEQTMLKPQNILKEVSIKDGKINHDEVKDYFKSEIPVYIKKDISKQVGTEPEAKPEPTTTTTTTTSASVGEKLLYRYSDFIIENTGATSSGTASASTNNQDINLSNQQDILYKYWVDKIWTNNLSKVVKTGDEIKKLSVQIKNTKAKDKNNDSIVIQGGIDPIIRILKIFNRAYKLHTTQVIPSGRKDGQVSNRTFREYTSFGGGDPSKAGSTGGPYRNNRIYDIWESAVLDIMSDRKYQPIFDKDTALQVGKKIKEGVGPIFRKMITDLLDGETLYRSKSGYSESSGGAQKAFLDKYFGDVDGVKDVKAGDLSWSNDPNEIVNNAEVSSGVKTTKLEFSNSKFDIKDPSGVIFMVKNKKSTSDEDVAENLYFYVSGGDGRNEVELEYSKSFGSFRNQIREIKSDRKYDLEGLPTSSGKVYKTKMTWEQLQKLWDKSSMTIEGTDKSEAVKTICQPEEVSWLSKIEDEKRTLFKMTKKTD